MIETNTILMILLLLILRMPALQGQTINISDGLTAVKIAENVYIHTYDNSNGIIFVNNGEAIIVSTPPSDDATLKLINWTKENLKAKITGFVIDMWHPDAMEGLDVVQKLGIKSYSSELTRTIAKEKGLPVPDIGFDSKLELKAGNEKLVCRYFGPAHTSDGIVVWLPTEKILFGGNGIRNYNGWVGNIGDANLNEWSKTIEKVKKEYGSAKIVVPGHGKYGGTELLDYTINLYKPNNWGQILRDHDIKRLPIFKDYGDIFEAAEQDSTVENTRFLKNAVLFIDNNKRYIKVESPVIEHNVANKSIKSEYGRLRIYNKSEGIDNPANDLYYNGLTINLRNDEVGIEIIVREMIR
jgi:glyoxylase-like metal-dependent hydrolase (beta-lactamase superfamily II)